MVDHNRLKDKIKALSPWFHNLHLGQDLQTAPDHYLGDFPRFKWDQIAPSIPADLSGKTVLDVGCNAGFYSFELAKRGAKVTGIDLDDHYLTQARWSAEILGLKHKVSFMKRQVYDLAHEEETYDITWFMGVFYHLRYPLLALDILSEKTKDLLVLQTLMLPGNESLLPNENYNLNDRKEMVKSGWPKMAFIEKRINNDPTNWWAPNKSAVEAMTRNCGFVLIAHPEPETFILKKEKSVTPPSLGWNRSEYLSAIGKDSWKVVQKKTKPKPRVQDLR